MSDQMNNPQDEKYIEDLIRLKRAFRAMSKSVNRALMTGTYEGSGNMMVKSYQRLQSKAAEAMPDDFFITSLELEIEEGMSDEAKLTQVQMAAQQLTNYIDGLLRDQDTYTAEFEDFRSFGTELRDQIIRMTKSTLKSALSGIDFEVPNPPEPPKPPEPPRKRRIQIDLDLGNDHDDFFDDIADEPRKRDDIL